LILGGKMEYRNVVSSIKLVDFPMKYGLYKVFFFQLANWLILGENKVNRNIVSTRKLVDFGR